MFSPRNGNAARVCSMMQSLKRARVFRQSWFLRPINLSSHPQADLKKLPAHMPPATKCAPSSPDTIGSRIGDATQ